jgi:hypothetical protein
LTAAPRGVALCFDTSCASFSIGSCHFFSSRPEILQRLTASVSLPSPASIKDHGRVSFAFCHHTWLVCVLTSSLPFSFLYFLLGVRCVGYYYQNVHTLLLNNSFVAILPVNTNRSRVAPHCTLIHSVLAEPAIPQLYGSIVFFTLTILHPRATTSSTTLPRHRIPDLTTISQLYLTDNLVLQVKTTTPLDPAFANEYLHPTCRAYSH